MRGVWFGIGRRLTSLPMLARSSILHESEKGREIEHNPDSWLESEMARSHRGILASLTVFGRAAIGGGNDPAPEANQFAHPQRILCAYWAASDRNCRQHFLLHGG